MGAIDQKSECLIRRRISRNQTIDSITLKLKSETLKSSSKHCFTVSSVVYKAAGVDRRYKR